MPSDVAGTRRLVEGEKGFKPSPEIAVQRKEPQALRPGLATNYADFFSRAQLLPPQQPDLLADFIFAQQSPLQSPDLAQQAAFAAV